MPDEKKTILKKYNDLIVSIEKYIEENPEENVIKIKYSVIKLKESLEIFNYSLNKNG